jgi:hypothetical protein
VSEDALFRATLPFLMAGTSQSLRTGSPLKENGKRKDFFPACGGGLRCDPKFTLNIYFEQKTYYAESKI